MGAQQVVIDMGEMGRTGGLDRSLHSVNEEFSVDGDYDGDNCLGVIKRQVRATWWG